MAPKSMIIYRITNVVNGKRYIGQTQSTLEARWAVHVRRSFKSKSAVTALGAAIRKYGIQSFRLEIVDQASSRKVLNEKEKYWIKKCHTRAPRGYNLTDGGDGMEGFRFSIEVKQRMSESHRGKTQWTKEQKAQISKRVREWANKPEVKASISARMSGKNNHQYGKRGKKSAFYGREHSAESIEKMRLNAGKRDLIGTKQLALMLGVAASGLRRHLKRTGVIQRKWQKDDPGFISLLKSLESRYPSHGVTQ